MKKFIEEYGLSILLFVIVTSLVFACLWFSVTQEANTFNKFTKGKKATAWDALFAELRIDADGGGR